MSSDNGIYILKTKPAGNVYVVPDEENSSISEGFMVRPDTFEYRVVHAQCIENLYYDVATGQHNQDFTPEDAYMYFKECQVFYDEGKASAYAFRLAEQHPILEYGVSILNHGEQIFQEFTDEQLKAYDDRIEGLIQQHREDRERKKPIG